MTAGKALGSSSQNAASHDVARLREALAAEKARAAATDEILRVISRSSADIQPVFDLIVRKSAELSGASFCTLDRLEGDELHLAAQHGFEGRGLDGLMATYPLARIEGSMSFKAIDAGTVAHIEDA